MSPRFVLLLTTSVALVLTTPGSRAEPPTPKGKEASSKQQLACIDRYDDPLPPGALARLGTARFRQGSSAWTVAFSPNGRTVASADWNGNVVRLWEASTGKEIRVLRGHTSGIYAVAFSPDGKVLASSTKDDIRLWQPETGKQQRQFGGKIGDIITVAFSPDGRMLASGGLHGTVRLWDLLTGREVWKLEGRQVCLSPVVFCLGGKALATGHWDGTVCLWDTATGKELGRFKGHKEEVRGLAVSADGKRLASVDEQSLRLWDVTTGKEMFQQKSFAGGVSSVAFSPDSRMLACGDKDGTAHLSEAVTGRKRRALGPHFSWVPAVAFSPDGGFAPKLQKPPGKFDFFGPNRPIRRQSARQKVTALDNVGRTFLAIFGV